MNYYVKQVNSILYTGENSKVHTVFLSPASGKRTRQTGILAEGDVRPYGDITLEVDDPVEWKLGRRVTVAVTLEEEER